MSTTSLGAPTSSGWEERGGIGNDQVFVDPELIARADMRGGTQRLVPAIVVAHHPEWRPAGFEQFDRLRRRRPQIEADPVVETSRAVVSRWPSHSQTVTQTWPPLRAWLEVTARFARLDFTIA
ncbi:hypothetical protein ACVWZ6_008023 [Bradyrhizobium sp. GM6.1]